MKRLPHILIFVIAAIGAVALIGAVYLQGLLGQVHHVSRGTSKSPLSAEAMESDTFSASALVAAGVDWGDLSDINMLSDDAVKNLLLIGQDQRAEEEGGNQRSDSMIICSINTKTKKISLVSLMRDMYVRIPGYGGSKINAAYALGGMDLLDQTISENFGIKIDGNVEVNFTGFLHAMTSVGDLELTLNEEEVQYMNEHPGLGSEDDHYEGDLWHLKVGKNQLTPAQSLAYSRMRYVGNSDYDRVDRQRKVIMAAFNKVKTQGAGELIGLAHKILPNITTDLSSGELLSYIKTVAVDKITTLESYRVPVENTFAAQKIDGLDCLVPDLAKNSDYLQHYLYGTALHQDIQSADNQSAYTGGEGEGDGYTDPGVTWQPLPEDTDPGLYNYPSDTGSDVGSDYGYTPETGVDEGQGVTPEGTDPSEAPIDVPAEGGEEIGEGTYEDEGAYTETTPDVGDDMSSDAGEPYADDGTAE